MYRDTGLERLEVEREEPSSAFCLVFPLREGIRERTQKHPSQCSFRVEEKGKRKTHLFADVQDDHDDSEAEDGREQDDRHPRDPIPRSEVQRLGPTARFVDPFGLVRVDQDLRVGDDPFDVDKVLGLVSRRADKEVLDVVVGASETAVSVRSREGHVRRLRQLGDWERRAGGGTG